MWEKKSRWIINGWSRPPRKMLDETVSSVQYSVIADAPGIADLVE